MIAMGISVFLKALHEGVSWAKAYAAGVEESRRLADEEADDGNEAIAQSMLERDR